MNVRRELIEAITRAVLARGGRREGDEIRFQCPEPGHHEHGDADASAGWNEKKTVWFCPVGGIGGVAIDLATRLGVTAPGRVAKPSLETFAAQRGLTSANLGPWGVVPTVHAGRPGLCYPTPVGVNRIKYVDGGKPKYRWAEKGAGGRAHWYGLDRALGILRERAAALLLVLYLVNGEPSVWAAAAQRVPAVCLCGGEGAKLTRDRLAELRGALTGLPPVALRIVYDADPAGGAGALAARDALVAGGFLDVDALDIAVALPGVRGADVDDLQRQVGAGLADALAKLPRLPADPGPSISKRTPQPSTDEAAPAATSGCPSLFTKDGRFIPARCGAYLAAESTILLGHDRRLWRYVRGVYRPDADDWIAERVRNLVGEKFQRQQIDQVTAWLRAQLPSLGHEPPTQFINCRNGLLDWQTGELHPHTPEVRSTNQLPIDWRPEAMCPTIIRFFAETISWDALDLVDELLGYACYAGNPFRKAVMLLGPGGNGKSVLLGLFRGLLGTENLAAVSLQALGEDRFAGADLFGMLANICGDLDARTIERTDLFKQLTGNDVIRAQRKFRDSFNFFCYALPLFSANEAPRTADQTDAWFNRWIILPMTQRFVDATDDRTPTAEPTARRADTVLAATLASELDGLLVRAVTGLQRLIARGHFVYPPSVVEACARYRLRLDTVRGFVAEHCHLDVEDWVERADLYRRYRTWCQEGGRLPLSNATFNDHLGQAFPDRIDVRKRHGIWIWQGLAWGPRADGDANGGFKGSAPGTTKPASAGAGGATGATSATLFSPPQPPSSPPSTNRGAGAAGDGGRWENVPPLPPSAPTQAVPRRDGEGAIGGRPGEPPRIPCPRCNVREWKHVDGGWICSRCSGGSREPGEDDVDDWEDVS